MTKLFIGLINKVYKISIMSHDNPRLYWGTK